MAFCKNCGAELKEGANFCDSCGANTREEQKQSFQQGADRIMEFARNTADDTGSYDKDDIGKNKTMAWLAYILFLIPLLAGAHKTSPFVKYHTNQGAALFVIWVVYIVISSILSAIIKVPYTVWGFTVYHTPGWLSTILWIIGLPIFALCVLGIINAVNGKAKELPIIGKYSLIK